MEEGGDVGDEGPDRIVERRIVWLHSQRAQSRYDLHASAAAQDAAMKAVC